mmetsp:Transcript_30538/g.90606  ORF Transcript_30538/g.90606 Transcript_30538/m.90606 type:complete len:212 (+) Transcript_30538:463-1098(+)
MLDAPRQRRAGGRAEEHWGLGHVVLPGPDGERPPGAGRQHRTRRSAGLHRRRPPRCAGRHADLHGPRRSAAGAVEDRRELDSPRGRHRLAEQECEGVAAHQTGVLAAAVNRTTGRRRLPASGRLLRHRDRQVRRQHPHGRSFPPSGQLRHAGAGLQGVPGGQGRQQLRAQPASSQSLWDKCPSDVAVSPLGRKATLALRRLSESSAKARAA